MKALSSAIKLSGVGKHGVQSVQVVRFTGEADWQGRQVPRMVTFRVLTRRVSPVAGVLINGKVYKHRVEGPSGPAYVQLVQEPIEQWEEVNAYWNEVRCGWDVDGDPSTDLAALGRRYFIPVTAVMN